MTEPEQVLLDIDGMSCQHCVAAVKEKLASMPGVASVDVTLNPGLAAVTGTGLDRAALRLAVDELGYEASIRGFA